MSTKNSTQVVIAGKIFTVKGYEEEDYLQKVASYINNKVSSLKKLGGMDGQQKDMANLMIQLNLADDYFKAKKQAEVFEEEMNLKEKELYELRHELASYKLRLEEIRSEYKALKKDFDDEKFHGIEMSTELKTLKEK